jgi:hypothetical protein
MIKILLMLFTLTIAFPTIVNAGIFFVSFSIIAKIFDFL